MPPLEGEVPNEREAEGFVRKLSKKTPQSARSGCQLPFQGSQGGFAARVARLATPTSLILLTMRSYIFNSCNRCGVLSAPTVWAGKLPPFNKRLSCVHFGRLRASPTGSEAFGL